MQHQEIKRCPFCGSKDIFNTWHEIENAYSIYCPICYAHGPIKMNESQSIEAWNKRYDN